MPKKLLLFVGVLCWASPFLSRGIGGVRWDRETYWFLYLVGIIALVGAAILHQMEKRSGRH